MNNPVNYQLSHEQSHELNNPIYVLFLKSTFAEKTSRRLVRLPSSAFRSRAAFRQPWGLSRRRGLMGCPWDEEDQPLDYLPSGKRLSSNAKSPFLLGIYQL